MSKKIGFYLFFMFIFIFPITGCTIKNNTKKTDIATDALNIGQMQSVCELATLECYYHNTAKLDSQNKVLFWNTSKKLWIEYSGIVKIGIDISKLKLNVNNNIVTITLPNAKILSCEIDETSLSENNFYSESKGLGSGSVNAKDQSMAFAEAQKSMLETASKDDALLFQARERARTLLDNYVKNIGDAIGIEYEIQWELLQDTD